MSDENPFAELWDELKERGRIPTAQKGKHTRYVVQLSDGEMKSLVAMRKLYPEIDSAIDRITGSNEVEFRVTEAVRLAKKHTLS